jgi:two-component system alkaline phosphatase synthesis response regulator PhoP
MQRLLFITHQDWTELQNTLVRASYEVTRTGPDETTLLDALLQFRPDALLLELGDDTLLLQHVRRLLRSELNTRPIPLLALARRTHLCPPQLVVGVDDFLLPPYDPEELLARVQMLLWRYKRLDTRQRVQVGALTVDLARRVVTAAGQRVALTPREFQLLQFLATHRPRAFTRDALVTQVWGYDFEGDSRVVDAYVQRIRRKLGDSCGALVETVRGVGYRLGDASEEEIR